DAPPLRFVFCIKSNGLWAEMIQPRGFENRLPFAIDYDEKGRLANGGHGKARKLATPPADLELDPEVELSEV
ncbi:MAG: hypothetical protein GWO24_31705, partial [Akkermansiaceae bacterium]|nr:hypothetical protein [Akkermansiaceae bacterium]